MNEITIGSYVRRKDGNHPAGIGRVETWKDACVDDGVQYPPSVFVHIGPGYGYSVSVTDLILVDEEEWIQSEFLDVFKTSDDCFTGKLAGMKYTYNIFCRPDGFDLYTNRGPMIPGATPRECLEKVLAVGEEK
jgi:hypothetical protein